MAIHMKRMNPTLWDLYQGKVNRKGFSELIIQMVWDTVDKGTELSKSDKTKDKIKEALLSAKVVGLSTAAVVSNEMTTKVKKKKIMNATGYSKEQIAMDLDELQAFRRRGNVVKVFGDDIRYTAQIKKEWLGGIDTILGDAGLEALDSFYCLYNLERVYGNLSFSQVEDKKVDLSGLHVRMVAGDIHAEQAVSTNGLEDLMFVGGRIYYQDKAYTLEQFQGLLGNHGKGYQYSIKR